MLQQILLTTVIVPLVMGIVIAIVQKASGSNRLVVALLIPFAAVIASIGIEGLPPMVPVAAKQKLPFVLAGGGIVFTILSAILKDRLSRRTAGVLAIIALALPAWWLGKTVLAANPVKAGTFAVVGVLAILALTLLPARRAAAALPPAALPAALLWVAIAAALASVFGAYIGMAQMNGALAALTGGWLLARYVLYLRGDETAFSFDGMAAFSFIWTIAIGLVMTTLFAPSAAPAALVLAILPLGVAFLLQVRGIDFAGQPRFLRPLASGVLTAVPAVAAILIAAMQQA